MPVTGVSMPLGEQQVLVCEGALRIPEAKRTIEIAVRAMLAYAPGFRAAEPIDAVVTWCSMTASGASMSATTIAPGAARLIRPGTAS